MRVLMLSTDKSIFDEKSETGQRMFEYSRLVEKLDIFLIQKSDIFSAIKRGKKFEKPDLITVQDPFETGFIGWWLAKYFGAKLQLQVHTDFLNPYFRKEFIKNRIRVWLAKFLIPRADCIRVVSERIKDSILRRSNLLNIEVLPIWVDIEKIENASIKTDLHKKYPQFDFIILMASRLTREKNIGLAVSVMSDVVKKYPKTGLVVVGDGQEKENLKLKIKNLKLRDNVIIETWHEDLASYYKTADLFLLTSNYEGYGRTLVEAAAAGCKIVSSGVGIADEILEKENIFQINNEEQLKQRIIDAIEGKMLPARPLKIISREEYLRKYKQHWLACF